MWNSFGYGNDEEDEYEHMRREELEEQARKMQDVEDKKYDYLRDIDTLVEDIKAHAKVLPNSMQEKTLKVSLLKIRDCIDNINRDFEEITALESQV